MEGASAALQDIAERLNDLAEALPAESALLGTLGERTKVASSLLKPLFKHVEMITIVARSARIEAASLDKDRDSFLEFTREAFELGKSVQHAVKTARETRSYFLPRSTPPCTGRGISKSFIAVSFFP